MRTDSVFQVECPRCDGKGKIDAFRHIKSGTCFLCAGEKVLNLKTAVKAKLDEKTYAVLRTTVYPDGYETKTVEFFVKGESVKMHHTHLANDECLAQVRILWKWFQQNATVLTRKYDQYGCPV